jgi:cation diffusion facilitator CzcD-associated flavoprotein CzcO
LAGVVIVGAGPAGLSAAVSLRARGIEATILEPAARVGEPWRHFAAIKIELAGPLREAAKDGRRIARAVSHELRSPEAPRAVTALDA